MSFYSYFQSEDTVVVNILAKPSSNQNMIGEVVEVNNKHFLKIHIKSPPEDGKANLELVNFLSKMTKTPKSRISILHGFTSRHKIVSIKKCELKSFFFENSKNHQV